MKVTKHVLYKWVRGQRVLIFRFDTDQEAVDFMNRIVKQEMELYGEAPDMEIEEKDYPAQTTV